MNNPEPEGAEPSTDILEPDSAAALADMRRLAGQQPELPSTEQMLDEIQAGIDAQYGPLTTPVVDYDRYELATWREIRERIERDKNAIPAAPPATTPSKRPPPRRAPRRTTVSKEG
jgi:hypothetical protein